MKKTSSLKWKITGPIITTVIVGNLIIISILLIAFSGKTTQLSTQYLTQATHDYATQVANKLELTLNTATALSSSVEQIASSPNPQREDILVEVNKVLSEHSELVGIGVGFEPNAFDGKDASNIGRKHSDASGRFVPYTFREGNAIDYTILAGYDDPGPDGSWYSVPKATGKSYVTSPYWYEVGAEKFLMVTCVAPLQDKNGKFLGMVGFDLLLDSLNGILENVELFDSGYITMVSPDGTIAYNPNKDILGKTISEVFSAEILSAVEEAAQTGQAATADSISTVNGKKILNTIMPIEVGESGGRWMISTSVPKAELNKEVSNSAFVSATICLLVTALIWMVVRNVLNKRVIKPIVLLEKAAASMAAGNLKTELDYESNDELGSLANSMRQTMQTLSAYVGNISETLQSMAQGNMQIAVDMDYVGDFAPIKGAIEEIVSSLNQMFSRINEASEQVSSGSEQVSSGAQALSQGATEQASATDQLSATIADISVKVEQNAENAADANQKAGLAGVQMNNSNKQMQRMIVAMDEITGKSTEISKIIKTIEDIAFQTNILALNAAVEAARAGAAGKGFAVVADEVRNLAGKSAIAAKNTTELIEESLQAVQNGAKIANETAHDLETVLEISTSMITLIEQIAQATGGQADAIRQVSVGIDQISAVVQTNSATAEQSAAASAELSGQAHLLKGLVSKVRLKEKAKVYR